MVAEATVQQSVNNEAAGTKVLPTTVRLSEIVKELKEKKSYPSFSAIWRVLKYDKKSGQHCMDGNRNFPLHVVERAVNELGVSPEYLFLGSGEKFLS